MIGIFDSGVGGICAYRAVRRLLPREDIIYLADRRNAPYGTKSEDEIALLTEKNIRLLYSVGASRVLIACCTASSVYDRLPEEVRKIGVPIIRPAAKIAAQLGCSIAVIATERTADSHAFKQEITALTDVRVTEWAEQRLVSLVEGGCRDGRTNPECEEILGKICERVRLLNAGGLVLGCTHFSHLKWEFSRRLPKVKIISPAHIGAREIADITVLRRGRGRDIYM